MKLPVPTHSTYNPANKTSILQFSDDIELNGEYMMRGAISYPVQVSPTEIRGFVLMAGFNIDSKKVYVFEESYFECIDHILNENRLIEYEGVAPWFNMCHTKYFGTKYYYRENEQTHFKYRQKIRRSDMIKPKPRFTELDWNEQDDVPLQLVNEYIEREKIICGTFENSLESEIRVIDSKPDKYSPPLLALKALLVGIDRFPYRKGKPTNGLR